jgi:hypothetical protein
VKMPPPIPNSVKDWAFNTLAMTFFVLGIYSLLWRQPFRNATAALLAAAFCALIGNPDRLQMIFSLLTGYKNQNLQSTPTIRNEQPAAPKIFGDGQ